MKVVEKNGRLKNPKYSKYARITLYIQSMIWVIYSCYFFTTFNNELKLVLQKKKNYEILIRFLSTTANTHLLLKTKPTIT